MHLLRGVQSFVSELVEIYRAPLEVFWSRSVRRALGRRVSHLADGNLRLRVSVFPSVERALFENDG